MFDIKAELESILNRVEARRHYAQELGNEKVAEKLGKLSATLKKALAQLDAVLKGGEV